MSERDAQPGDDVMSSDERARLQAEIDALRAENERLRAAVRRRVPPSAAAVPRIELASAPGRPTEPEAAGEDAETVERLRTDALERSVHRVGVELQRARELFAAIFHASPVAAVITRISDAEIIDVNERYLSYFGTTRERALAMNTIDLGFWAHPEERAPMMAALERDGELRDVEIQVRLAREDEVRTVLASIELLELDGQRCALTLFVDITERKRDELRIRALSRALTLAEQRERRRISEVLHDDLQQVLFGLEMRFHMLTAALEASPLEPTPASQRIERHLGDVTGLTRRAIDLARSLSLELNPPVLREEGLAAALAWLVSHMKQFHGLSVDLHVAPDVEVDGADQCALLIQFVRELLTNIVRHAGVDRAVVNVERRGDDVIVDVDDEGRGFELDAARRHQQRGGKLGLFSVEERLRLFGGRLEIDTAPGHGTRVRIVAPLQAPGAPAAPPRALDS